MTNSIVDDTVLDALLGLTPEQRYSLVCILLDSLEHEQDLVTAPEEEKAMLRERLASVRAHPERTVPWEEVRRFASRK